MQLPAQRNAAPCRRSDAASTRVARVPRAAHWVSEPVCAASRRAATRRRRCRAQPPTLVLAPPTRLGAAHRRRRGAPRALSRSSMRCTTTSSGSVLRMCSSSWSVVLLGTSSPFLLPTVMRPTSRVPAMLVLTTGMWSASSASNTALKFSLVPMAVRQYALVSMANTPTSLLFSKWTRCAIASARGAPRAARRKRAGAQAARVAAAAGCGGTRVSAGASGGGAVRRSRTWRAHAAIQALEGNAFGGQPRLRRSR